MVTNPLVAPRVRVTPTDGVYMYRPVVKCGDLQIGFEINTLGERVRVAETGVVRTEPPFITQRYMMVWVQRVDETGYLCGPANDHTAFAVLTLEPRCRAARKI